MRENIRYITLCLLLGVLVGCKPGGSSRDGTPAGASRASGPHAAGASDTPTATDAPVAATEQSLAVNSAMPAPPGWLHDPKGMPGIATPQPGSVTLPRVHRSGFAGHHRGLHHRTPRPR